MASPDHSGSPEYEAVQHCAESLVTALQHCISTVTTACLSKRLISKDVEQYTFTDHSNIDKARLLVSCVCTSIQNDSTKFSAFVEVLRLDSFLEGVLNQLLEALEEYSEWPGAYSEGGRD